MGAHPVLEVKTKLSSASRHGLGVACGLAAGAWLGAAEAPTKLVTAGFSPFLISLCMVAGVFVARWTLPVMLKGTGYLLSDFRDKIHLVIWALLAGMCWAVANTLTVFAVRNVGLSIAFPLWNINSLVGLFWGWLLFKELRGSGSGRVVGGAVGIVAGACLLAYSTSQQTTHGQFGGAMLGIAAALGAGLQFGTMYIPYRKAYISGMNPLSFVTVFTFGELGTVFALALMFNGGWSGVAADLTKARPALFWLFLGGFCWVIGDLFQQYAAKYIGIGRGIPLSNTNQLWGLAWGALVFGELGGLEGTARALVIGGSVIMILGAVSISSAVAPASEHASWHTAMLRECERYGLDIGRVTAAQKGEDPLAGEAPASRKRDAVIVVAAISIFVWLARGTVRPPITMNVGWMAALISAMMVLLVTCGWLLWKRTRFS